MQRLREWLDPTPPPDPHAASEARRAERERETVRILKGGIHARLADRQLRAARQELDRQKARLAVLDLRAAVRGREDA